MRLASVRAFCTMTGWKSVFSTIPTALGGIHGRSAAACNTRDVMASAPRLGALQPVAAPQREAAEELLVRPLPVAAALSGAVRSEWNDLNAANASAYAQYASPEWVEHLEATRPDKVLAPILVQRLANTLAGIVPIVRCNYDLSCVVRGHVLWSWRVPAVAVLGIDPCIPAEVATHDSVFAAISASDPDAEAIYLHSLPTSSFCWSYLRSSPWIRDHFLLHVAAGPRPLHLLQLPSSFDDFVYSFPRKKRYNLARQVRMLRDHVGGDLRLQRVDTPAHIAMFAEAARSMLRQSDARMGLLPDIVADARKADELADAARRGLLRSYVLFAGDAACAVVLGYMWRHIFHYAEVAYHPRFSAFSPGTVLLYLMVGDLIAHQPPRLVNFGIGDAGYKRTFGNVEMEDASVLLLRKGMANRLRRASHAQFLAVMRIGRRALESWPALDARLGQR